jgi:branched-subunit amino acid aminotransferase/4-amino-4-deoxychorismate lyase
MIIYLDNKYQDVDKDFADKFIPGVFQGVGVFETLLLSEGRPLYLVKHYDRLLRGINHFKLSFNCRPEFIYSVVKEVASRNGIMNGRVRISVWSEGKRTKTMVVAQKISGSKKGGGASICISPWSHQKKKHSHLKTLDYGLFYKAYKFACNSGYDEALLIDKNKMMIEGSRTNIFCISKGSIYTPPVISGCLRGVTRDVVISLARRAGYECIIKYLPLKELKKYDEIFLTNSISGIMPVNKVDDFRLKSAEEGSVVNILQRLYAADIKNPKADHFVKI